LIDTYTTNYNLLCHCAMKKYVAASKTFKTEETTLTMPAYVH